jgi:hypothetical protein
MFSSTRDCKKRRYIEIARSPRPVKICCAQEFVSGRKVLQPQELRRRDAVTGVSAAGRTH